MREVYKLISVNPFGYSMNKLIIESYILCLFISITELFKLIFNLVNFVLKLYSEEIK